MRRIHTRLPVKSSAFVPRRTSRHAPHPKPAGPSVANMNLSIVPQSQHVNWNSTWKIYYINLSHRQDRNTAMQNEFRAQGFDNAKDIQKIQATHGANLNLTVMRLAKQLEHPTMSRGEVGCYQSHVATWKRFLDDPTNMYGFVFEDDITFLTPTFALIMQDTLDKLEKQGTNWDVLYLSRYYYGEECHPHFWEGPEIIPGVYKPQHLGGGACGYVLSRTGAQKLINLAYPIKQPLDMMIFNDPSVICLSFKTFLVKPRNIADSETMRIV